MNPVFGYLPDSTRAWLQALPAVNQVFGYLPVFTRVWVQAQPAGDPSGNRTPVSGVRGRRLDRLTNGPFPRFLPGFYLYPKDLSSGLALLVHLQGLEPGTH